MPSYFSYDILLFLTSCILFCIWHIAFFMCPVVFDFMNYWGGGGCFVKTTTTCIAVYNIMHCCFSCDIFLFFTSCITVVFSFTQCTAVFDTIGNCCHVQTSDAV